MSMRSPDDIGVIPVAPSLLGESPVWHATERSLYWCDIPGHKLNRFNPASGQHDEWAFDTDVACCAPALGGELLLALRTGLVSFDPATGRSRPLAKPPYDPAIERFNDGKADPQGRFWVGTIDDARAPEAALYRLDRDGAQRMAGGITTSNGLAWSPDGERLYFADSRRNLIWRFRYQPEGPTLLDQEVFVEGGPGPDELHGGTGSDSVDGSVGDDVLDQVQPDLDMALRAIAFGAMGTAGQRCTTLRRLFVHESVYDALLPRLKTWHESRVQRDRDRRDRVPRERHAPGQRLVGHHRERPEIRATINICITTRLFG